LRLGLGLPDGSRDLVVDKSILLESGFDELNGVDWKKGCYMGQELTARTKYRGLVKKRLVPVVLDGAPPDPGTPVMLAGREAGELRSAAATENGGIGLALLRLESLAEAGGMTAGDVGVTPRKAPWMAF
jgi:folate-binding protein YgfZ